MILLVATGNAHKAVEIAHILNNTCEVKTLKDIGFTEEIVEDGKTFRENAEIKVRALHRFVQVSRKFEFPLALLADDSGMEVDHLKGAPGVYSARYAGEPCNDEANNRKLLKELSGVPGNARTSRFQCVLASTILKASDDQLDSNQIRFFQGTCPGKIGFEPKGTNGFGYDPIFFPDGFCKTYAELTREEKNQISHRAKALAEFKKWFFSEKK